MALTDADMNQILNHMGHTWEVHRTYYRHYDSIGERLDVAKLLMLQDQNRLNEYRQKGLTNIDPRLLQQASFRGKVFIEHVRLCKSKILTLFGNLLCVFKNGPILLTLQLCWPTVVVFNPWPSMSSTT